MDVPGMDAVVASVQSDADADVMAHDGVHPDSMVLLVAS
jgi:hypothetical protein